MARTKRTGQPWWTRKTGYKILDRAVRTGQGQAFLFLFLPSSLSIPPLSIPFLLLLSLPLSLHLSLPLSLHLSVRIQANNPRIIAWLTSLLYCSLFNLHSIDILLTYNISCIRILKWLSAVITACSDTNTYPVHSVAAGPRVFFFFFLLTRRKQLT
jgi:hypothetical protein